MNNKILPTLIKTALSLHELSRYTQSNSKIAWFNSTLLMSKAVTNLNTFGEKFKTLIVIVL